MKVKLIESTDDPQSAIARAARVSREPNPVEEDFSESENQKLIRKLKDWGHWSPFEFASATFFIEGVSRSCLAQLTRHRLANFMVRSMRYVEQNVDEVVVPDSVKEADLEKDYKDNIRDSYDFYQKALDEGVPKEDARFGLPIGSKTSLFFKANFREFRHVINLRGSEDAQWEIRELANEFHEQLSEIAPSVFEDLEVENR